MNMLKQTIKILAITLLFTNYIQAADEYTYEVRSHDLSPPVTLSGTVIPKKEVTFAAQLPGRVATLIGEEGDRFSENTILLELDNRELLAKRRAAIAEWRNADATLRNAGVQYTQQLWSPDSPDKAPGGMGLPHLLDQFLTKPISDLMGRSNEGLDRRSKLHGYGVRIEQARNALWQAKSKIEQIDSKLRDAKSIAPFNGVIVKKMAEVGDTVMMGQTLLQFADTEQLQIEVDVPARLVRGLKIGKQISAKLDVLDKSTIISIARIFPIADKQRHTIKVKFDIPEEARNQFGEYVGPGQYAQVDVPDVKAGQQNLLLIPKSAVMQRNSLPGVCVLQNNKPEIRLIRVGQKINPTLISELDQNIGNYVTVLSGLASGDQVLVNSKCK
ncbi:efflux RND transporter periplasmic adaptor subunit [Candidatus Halobeggiatoa sp. HSG11]|nr:efflux RND transporter periplasmic adaptor subunit [Candidatus Halobeggiatoa sp. HSG11]